MFNKVFLLHCAPLKYIGQIIFLFFISKSGPDVFLSIFLSGLMVLSAVFGASPPYYQSFNPFENFLEARLGL